MQQKKNLDSAIDNLKAAVKEEYKYVYAGLSWAEYWAAEGVQAAGDSSSPVNWIQKESQIKVHLML